MLTNIASEDLEHLLGEVESGEVRLPLSSITLMKIGLASLTPYLELLRTFDQATLTFVLQAVLAERQGLKRPPELVWTGPEGRLASARSTVVVFRELLASVRRSVWMAGYAVDHGEDLFEPLHRAMVEHGVRASFLLNLDADETRKDSVDSQARLLVNEFVCKNWPFEGPRPTFYYDPRTLEARVYASMHAKTLVIDEASVLIGSANFTNRGQTRNIEAGALIHDVAFAKALVTQFRSLIDGGYIRSANA